MIKYLIIVLFFVFLGVGNGYAQQDYYSNGFSFGYSQKINDVSNVDSVFSNKSNYTFLFSHAFAPWLNTDIGFRNSVSNFSKSDFSNLYINARWTMDDGKVFHKRASIAPFIGLGFNVLYFGYENLRIPDVGIDASLGFKYRLSNRISVSAFYLQQSQIYSFTNDVNNNWFDNSFFGINLSYHFTKKNRDFIVIKDILVDSFDVSNYDTLFNQGLKLLETVNSNFNESYIVGDDSIKTGNDSINFETSNSLKLQLWLSDQNLKGNSLQPEKNILDSAVIVNSFLNYNYYTLDKLDSTNYLNDSQYIRKNKTSEYYYGQNNNYQRPIVNIRKSGEFINVEVTGGKGVEINIDSSLINPGRTKRYLRRAKDINSRLYKPTIRNSSENSSNNSLPLNSSVNTADVVQTTSSVVRSVDLEAIIKTQSNKIDKLEQDYDSLLIMMNKLLALQNQNQIFEPAILSVENKKDTLVYKDTTVNSVILYDTVFVSINKTDTIIIENTKSVDSLKIKYDMMLSSYKDSINNLNNSISQLKENLAADRTNVLNQYYSIQFDENKFKLSPETLSLIENKVIDLKGQKYFIVVSGYSDSRGDAKYNKSISRKRAEFISNILVEKGIQKSRILIRYYGEEFANPIPDAKDRRVDISIIRN